MRILHLGKFYPPAVGGIEVFLGDLCRRQVALGHQVTALCHRHAAPDVPDDCHASGSQGGPPLGQQGCTLEDTIQDGVRVLRAPTLAPASTVPFAPGFAARFRSLLRDFAPHIVHVHLPNLSALAALAVLPDVSMQRPSSPRMVIHWHAEVMGEDIPFPFSLAYPVYMALTRRVLSAARMVVVTSRQVLLASHALAPFRARCRVVPLGVDTARLVGGMHTGAPGKARTPGQRLGQALARHSESGLLVFALGRFAAYKGFDQLVRAAALLPGLRVLIGGDGPGRAEIAALVRREGLEGRVHLPGRLTVQECDACMAACDIFCLPSVSRAEAFGLVLLEAMAHAKPVVAAVPQGSGVGSVLAPGVTGLAVPPGSPAALAQAIGWLAQHPEAARRMGSAGQLRLHERFRIETVADALDTVYREALNTTEPR